LKGKPKYIIYKFTLFVGYMCMSYVHSWRSYCESRTGIKVMILTLICVQVYSWIVSYVHLHPHSFLLTCLSSLSTIWWWTVLLAEETGVPLELPQVTEKLYHKELFFFGIHIDTSTWIGNQLTSVVCIAADCLLSRGKSSPSIANSDKLIHNNEQGP